VTADLRKWVILAGFPYHKNPHLYQWLWVYILLPFLEEETLNELAEKHGKDLRALYQILRQHPDAFCNLIQQISLPLFFKELAAYTQRDASYQSRHRPILIVDDTQNEKFGKCIAFVKKLFDHKEQRYIMAHNMVLILVGFGNFVFPLTMSLWRPKDQSGHQSKNRIVADFLERLKAQADQRGLSLKTADITFDSAYTAGFVVQAARDAGLRVTSKAKSHYVFEFEGQTCSTEQIVGIVKERNWESLHNGSNYQFYRARHNCYGTVILVIRKRTCQNGKMVYDVLFSTQLSYRAFQVDHRYHLRWEIEMHFKYYKQHLMLGKTAYRTEGSIQSAMYCVVLAGIIVALDGQQFFRKVSFKTVVKHLKQKLRTG